MTGEAATVLVGPGCIGSDAPGEDEIAATAPAMLPPLPLIIRGVGEETTVAFEGAISTPDIEELLVLLALETVLSTKVSFDPSISFKSLSPIAFSACFATCRAILSSYLAFRPVGIKI